MTASARPPRARQPHVLSIAWPLLAEFCLSTMWAFTYLVSLVLFIIGLLVTVPGNLAVPQIFPPAFTGLLLGMVCLGQFSVSLLIERRYEKKLFSSLFWIIWFPVMYWMLSLCTTLVAFTLVMLKSRRKRARWVSPDRGIGRIKP